MKKTNVLLILILLVLGSATAWYLVTKRNTSLSGYDYDFAVQDTAAITKIALVDRQGKAVSLTRVGKNAWLVNGKHSVRTDAINNLLYAINRVELKYRLPRNAVVNVVKDLASSGIKVDIYGQNDAVLKSYYVGGTNMDETGTHFIMEGSNEPYVCHIPGFEGGLRVRYFTDEIDWRDRYVFRLEPEDIASVSIDYPLQKGKAFKMMRENGREFKVEPLYELTPKIQQPVNQGLVETFLTGFKTLGCEGFENGHPKEDSIRATVPFAVITVKTTNGAEKTVRLHQMVPINNDGNVIKSTEGTVTVERYWTEVNNGDFLMVQHQVFEKVFWPYQAFFMRPSMKN